MPGVLSITALRVSLDASWARDLEIMGLSPSQAHFLAREQEVDSLESISSCTAKVGCKSFTP